MDKYTATEIAYKNGYEQGLRNAIKRGRWLAGMVCSECGKIDWNLSNYCPNCGAKMTCSE